MAAPWSADLGHVFLPDVAAREAEHYSDGLILALMPGYHNDLIALELAAQHNLGLAMDDPLAKSRGHHLGIIGIDPQLLGELLVGEIRTHEVEA